MTKIYNRLRKLIIECQLQNYNEKELTLHISNTSNFNKLFIKVFIF